MGTSVSLAYEKSDFGVPEHNLKKISEYKDKRFGQVTILREKIAPKRMFLRKTVPYTSDEDIRSIQKKIPLRQTLPDFYAQITGNNVEKVDRLCLQELRMEITVHYSKNNLQTEIKKRSETNKGFEIEELMHILMALVHFCDALDLFKTQEQMLGPEIIMLYPRGLISVMETQFLRPGINRYKKMLAISYEPIKPDRWEILAPEELICLKERKKESNCSIEKIHSFTIGIIMLCALACKGPDWFYDLAKFQYLPDKAEEVLKVSNLNFEFLELIRSCLIANPVERPSSADLLDKIELLKVRLQIDSNLEEVMFQKNANNISMY